MQVVTNDNFQQLIETGKVAEFKAPEAPKPAAEVATNGAKQPASETAPNGSEQPRGADGKFTKAAEGDKNTTAAGATPAEPDDEGGDDLPEHARKVIGKKHRAMKEAEEFGKEQFLKRTAAETRAEKLERDLQEERAKSRPAAEKAKEPDPKDFATVAEYTDALVKYRVAETLQAERDKAEQQRQADEKAAREREFGKRLAETKAKHPDFDEVMGEIAGSDLDKVPMDVVEYIQESDHGGELMYHLAKNPETLERLRKLSPRRFIAELGKLEAKWDKPAETQTTLSQAAATTTTPGVSKAPAPIAALASDKSTVVHKDPKDMSFQELREHERQREAERRARR